MNTTLFFISGSLLYLLAYSLGLRDGEVDEANERIRRAVAQSQIEAESIRECAATLRAKALDAISRQPATADEVADQVGASVLAMRPRVTELAKMGQIEDSGERRKNASGRSAIVWRTIK